MRAAWVVLGLSLVLPAAAAAQTAPPPPPPTAWAVPGAPYVPPPEPVHPRRVFSLTIAPVRLLLPMVELTAEVRAHDRLGIAVIGGGGRVSDSSGGVRVSAAAYDVGGQLRFYALGDFRRGLEVGAEVLYLHLADSNLSVTGEGLVGGPFVGYKITADAGFTFDVQLGFAYVGVRAMTTGASASDSQFIPLLNLNIGWSF